VIFSVSEKIKHTIYRAWM